MSRADLRRVRGAGDRAGNLRRDGGEEAARGICRFGGAAWFDLFAGSRPLKISLTYICATLKGVPLRLSSCRSSPRVSMIFSKCQLIVLIFSSSVLSKASFRSGVS